MAATRAMGMGLLTASPLQMLGASLAFCATAPSTSYANTPPSPLLARASLPAGVQASKAALPQRTAAHAVPSRQHSCQRSAAGPRSRSVAAAATGCSTNGSTPVEELLEVAVRAAQAGAAVRACPVEHLLFGPPFVDPNIPCKPSQVRGRKASACGR